MLKKKKTNLDYENPKPETLDLNLLSKTHDCTSVRTLYVVGA